jgi:AraC-like DNA-binding protein
LAGSEENRSYLLALVSLPAGRSGSSGDVPDLISGLLSLCAESLPAGSFWSVLDGHTGFLAARIDRGSPRTKDPRSLTLSFERALEHFGQSAGFGCSIFVSPCPVAFQGLCAEWERLRNLRDLRDGDGLALIMSESSSRGGPDQTLDAVNRFIDSNLSSDVSLTAIADSVGLNPSYLSRWYVQKTGVHLSERVAQVRCDRARELLLQGDSKIAEIAAAVGFWTPSHFIKFFKKRVGATPQEFRGRSAPGSV